MPVTALIIGLMVATSDAGSKLNSPVVIGRETASGSMADARSSAFALMSIGCHTRYGDGIDFGLCTANDGQGNVATCISFDPPIVNQMRALDDSSRLQFWWDEAGTCRQVSVLVFSTTAPKVP